MYGGNSNYYGLFFVAEEEGRENGVWEVDEEPRTVLHAMHVDDCGEAYVALAECGDRRGVSGQCLISLLVRTKRLMIFCRSWVRSMGLRVV